MCPARAMGPAELRGALAADPAVTTVVHKSTKTSQVDVGSQYTDHSMIVYVAGFPSKPVEFELALHQELCTATACFKPPPEGVEAVAWQILMRVVEGRELMPVWARRYARAAIERVKQRLAEEADVEDACDSEPGSASHAGPAPEEPPLKKHKPQAEEDPPASGPGLPVGPPEAPPAAAGAAGAATSGPGSRSLAASTPEGPSLKRRKVEAEPTGTEAQELGTASSPDWAADAEHSPPARAQEVLE